MVAHLCAEIIRKLQTALPNLRGDSGTGGQLMTNIINMPKSRAAANRDAARSAIAEYRSRLSQEPSGDEVAESLSEIEKASEGRNTAHSDIDFAALLARAERARVDQREAARARADEYADSESVNARMARCLAGRGS